MMDLNKKQDEINELCRQRDAINSNIRKLQGELDNENDRLFHEEINNYSDWLKANPNSNSLSARALYDKHKNALKEEKPSCF